MPATQTRSTFRLELDVSIDIEAPREAVWALLTDAEGIPRWNSAVTRIEGTIEPGGRIAVRVPFSDRTFNLKIIELDAPHRMVWADGFAPMFRGERTYTLTPTDTGCTFRMTEVFGGLMLPVIAGSLPDMAPSFDAWAQDLKAEAERA